MAYFLAVANRKGGVGKSTVSVLLAQAFAAWGRKKVLLLDLDTQCNASLILIGGERWRGAHKSRHTIADYFYDKFDGDVVAADDYLLHDVGDILQPSARAPDLWLLPGSLLLEDVQGEIYLKQATQSRDPAIVSNHVRQRLIGLLKRFEYDFDLIVMDCPPGLSFAALAALKVAQKVLVPFRPDYVSELAIDRVALLIEDKYSQSALDEVAKADRRYVCVPNCVRPTGRDRILLDTIAYNHPMLGVQLPQHDALANAFDWQDERQSMEEKYGEATPAVRVLYDAVGRTIGL